MIPMKSLVPVLAAGSVLIASSANGAIVPAVDTETPSSNPHSGTIAASGSDLLTGLSPSSSGLFNSADSAGFTSLVDGAIATNTGSGAVGANGDVVRLGAGDFLVYDLDVSVNTLGYDLTSIATYTSWGDNRAGQEYTVSVSKVGEAGFTTLYTLAEQAAIGVVQEVVLTNSGGGTLSQGAVTATGVDAIRFDFADAPANWSAYREIDVIGTATVPEPGSLALLGLGGLCMMKRRRRA